jgi:hypothetical protein
MHLNDEKIELILVIDRSYYFGDMATEDHLHFGTNSGALTLNILFLVVSQLTFFNSNSLLTGFIAVLEIDNDGTYHYR